jgi:hypothetical protein
MPKFEINATELTDTDVNFIALVKRGANRIPFRLTKSEDADMDLYSLLKKTVLKGDGGTVVAPAVVGVYMTKAANEDAIIAMLKAAGVDFEPLLKGEIKGMTVYTLKSGVNPADTMMLKVSKDVALGISGLKKGFCEYDFNSSDFGENVATSSYVMSLSGAAQALGSVVSNVLQDAADPTAAAVGISKAVDDFKAYIMTLTKAVPVSAFKFDQALRKAELKKTGTGNAEGGAGGDQETGPGKFEKGKIAKGEGDLGGGDMATAVAGKDPLIPEKTPGNTQVAKADAGLNGTGAGAELGAGTETNAAATADDASNTAINAIPGGKLGGKTSGTDTGMPAELMASTQKAEVEATAMCKTAADLVAVGKTDLAQGIYDAVKAILAKSAADVKVWKDANDAARAATNRNENADDGDARTIGATTGLNPKLMASTQKVEEAKAALTKAELDLAAVKNTVVVKDAHTVDVTSILVTGEGADGAGAGTSTDEDSLAAQARATADDAKNAGGKVTGKVKGATLDTAGIPAKMLSPTTKNAGDDDAGKKGKNKEQQLSDGLSGAGAQENDVQTLKSENGAIMQAVAALSKDVKDGLAGVKKDVSALGSRVDEVVGSVKKHDAALLGTVFGEANDDVVVAFAKTADNAPPLMDTGFSRRA